jgi:hypothetical protein
MQHTINDDISSFTSVSTGAGQFAAGGQYESDPAPMRKWLYFAVMTRS